MATLRSLKTISPYKTGSCEDFHQIFVIYIAIVPVGRILENNKCLFLKIYDFLCMHFNFTYS